MTRASRPPAPYRAARSRAGAAPQRSLGAEGLAKLSRRLANRLPVIGGAISRHAANALAAEGSAESTRILAEAVACNRDEGIRDIATAHLIQVRDQSCVDAACAVWAATRHPALAALLVTRRLVASGPAKLRVLTALLVDRLDVILAMAGGGVPALLAACADAEPVIAERAAQLLRTLDDPALIEALCRRVIETDDAAAREVALAARYVPSDDAQRAAFLFLTGQSDAYEAFDFDNRLLRAAYASGTPDVRRRIMERVRAAGRTDLLTVVAGADVRSRLGELSDGECEFLVRMLSEHAEWPRLWSLVFELPPRWSARVVRLLLAEGWRPESVDARTVLEHLAPMVEDGAAAFVQTDEDLRRTVPPAVLRARCRVAGRANDLAFAPHAPVVAIASAERRVGLWNFQRGEMERVVRGFAHSLGRVGCMPDGTLVCAERTNGGQACTVYRCPDGAVEAIGQHLGSVTALEAVSDTHLLSTGRDGTLRLWDVTAATAPVVHPLALWPRAARVSPDGEHVLVLHYEVELLALPHLGVGTLDRLPSVARCAAFADADGFVVATHAGEVFAWRRVRSADGSGRSWWNRSALSSAPRPPAEAVVALDAAPERGVVFLGTAAGSVVACRWPTLAALGRLSAPGGRVSALRVSHDGSFLAVTDSEASLSLWDLRALDARRILAAPFARAVPSDVAAAAVLAAADAVPGPTRAAFAFIEHALRYRFRYDIDIGEAAAIRAGEFDIEIA